MIWIIALLCLLHHSESSFLAEVKARTRWCVGEGGKCPINLPWGFSSCCKPFVCTAIPKTCIPNRFLKFSKYKDYKCLFPAKVVTEVPSQLDDLVTTAQTAPGDVEASTTLSMLVNSSLDSSLSAENSGGQVQSEQPQFGNYSSLQESSQESRSNSDVKYVSDNGTQTADYESLSSSEELQENDNGKEVKLIAKRSIVNESSYSEEDIDSVVPFNSSNANQTYKIDNSTVEETDEAEDVTEVEGNISQVYSAPSNVYNSSEYFVAQNNMDSLNFSNVASVESIYTSVMETSPVNFLHSSEENITLITNTSSMSVNITSTEDSEEDWHSSQMKYDTRTVLHKVVTIPPFHISNFFQNVDVVKLNASVENSLDG